MSNGSAGTNGVSASAVGSGGDEFPALLGGEGGGKEVNGRVSVLSSDAIGRTR